MIVATAPSAIVIRLSGTAAGSCDADLAQDDDQHDGHTDEEHHLAGSTGVPARHRHLHALARARSTSP